MAGCGPVFIGHQMNIWNKVFIGAIIVTTIAVVALASVERKIRSTGQQHIVSLEQRIEETNGRITRIVTGTAAELSFEGLRNLLGERYDERGRAWFGCIVEGMREVPLPPALPQVSVQVTITGPFVPGAETEVVLPEHLRGVVYVFEENDEGLASTFLGRFTVDSEPTPTPFRDDEGNQKNGYRIPLITADSVGEWEIEQIFDAGRSRWSIFLFPPVDRIAGIFDQLTEEEKQGIPEDFWEQFQPRPMQELAEEDTDGVDTNVLAAWKQIRSTMDDPEADAAQDLAAMLDWLYERRSALRREKEATELDLITYDAAEEKAKAENEILESDGDLEEQRVGAMNVQRNAVRTQLEQIQTEIGKITLQIEKLQALNAAFVAKIAEYHAMAVEKIEEKAETKQSE